MANGGPKSKVSLWSVVFLKKHTPLTAFALLAVLFTIFSVEYLSRDLWFDEALTILNFALLDSPQKIYNSYFIPNNQIIHTILLHWYLQFAGAGFLRLFPFLCAMLTLGILWQFRSKYGTMPLFITLTSLALSTPFLIYGTALRGYMLSALFTASALWAAQKFMKSGSVSSWLFFAASALCGSGVMPGTLAALAGVLLFILPECGKKFYCSKRFLTLALTVPGTFLLFYLPIWKRLTANAALGEGWHNGFAMLLALLLALLFAFLPLILVAAAGKFRIRHNFRHVFIWLLPVPAAFCFKVAPFPRVFFPLFVLYCLLLTYPVKDFLALIRKKYGSKRCRLAGAILALLAICWGYFCSLDTPLRREISRLSSLDGQDDYIVPHFVQNTFAPYQTAAALRDIYAPEALPPLYVSFAADPWAMSFYYSGKVFFDGPQGKVNSLPANCAVVLAAKEDPEPLEKRLGIKLQKISQTPQHQIFTVSE